MPGAGARAWWRRSMGKEKETSVLLSIREKVFLNQLASLLKRKKNVSGSYKCVPSRIFIHRVPRAHHDADQDESMVRVQECKHRAKPHLHLRWPGTVRWLQGTDQLPLFLRNFYCSILNWVYSWYNMSYKFRNPWIRRIHMRNQQRKYPKTLDFKSTLMDETLW